MQFVISEHICSGCGTCLDICPAEAIKLINGRAVITIDCMNCGSCPRVCPEGAIKQVLPATVQKEN